MLLCAEKKLLMKQSNWIEGITWMLSNVLALSSASINFGNFTILLKLFCSLFFPIEIAINHESEYSHFSVRNVFFCFVFLLFDAHSPNINQKICDWETGKTRKKQQWKMNTRKIDEVSCKHKHPSDKWETVNKMHGCGKR